MNNQQSFKKTDFALRFGKKKTETDFFASLLVLLSSSSTRHHHNCSVIDQANFFAGVN
jgi:hypothetical protein